MGRPSPVIATGASSRVIAARLGVDLSVLADGVGSPVVDVTPVTTLPSADCRHASFRLTFADGRVLKGRQVASRADVGRIARLSSLLDPRYFPPVIAHRGRALLTRWVPGRPLIRHREAMAAIRMCGRLHAVVHRLEVPVDSELLRRRPLDWHRRLDGMLGDLVAREALGVRDARQVSRLAALHAPAVVTTGVCHTDFCGENVIIGDRGRVSVIDNEGLSVDACEYDLARTWYRWPMTAAQQRAYAEGYGRHAHVVRFAAHFLHWALLVVIESAAYRVRGHRAGARVPLDRLETLLRTHGRRETFPRLLGRD